MANTMAKKNSLRKKVAYSLAACLCVGVVCYQFYSHAFHGKESYEYEYSDKAFGNPLMGFAPPAENQEVGEDIQLLYLDVTWKELEPQKGHYDWEGIEKANHLQRWKEEGKQIVFRFLLDYPSNTEHRDLPDWLVAELADPGDRYSNAYGKGFSPNYEDPTLIAYYEKAVKAMGERWGTDSFFAYIELGALGHWGEWHVDVENGIRPLPNEAVRKRFIQPFQTAFPQSFLLMRRPFRIAKEENFGLYNDVFGNADATATWLDWIAHGGDYDQTEEKNALLAMPTSWQSRPIGGELTSSQTMAELLGDGLEETLEELQQAHVSFLGPKIAEDIGDGGQAYEQVLRQLGYRIWVSQFTIKKSQSGYTASLTLENSGTAPFYADWPLYLLLQSQEGQEVARAAVPYQLNQLLPGEQKKVSFNLDDFPQNQNLQGYRLSLMVESPLTKQAALRFANKGQEDNTVLELAILNQ